MSSYRRVVFCHFASSWVSSGVFVGPSDEVWNHWLVTSHFSQPKKLTSLSMSDPKVTPCQSAKWNFAVGLTPSQQATDLNGLTEDRPACSRWSFCPNLIRPNQVGVIERHITPKQGMPACNICHCCSGAFWFWRFGNGCLTSVTEPKRSK